MEMAVEDPETWSRSEFNCKEQRLMSNRGRYIGGHTIVRLDPTGPTQIADRRPKKIKNAEARERSKKTYAEAERTDARIEAERQALRRIDITRGDNVSLGCNSSGWSEYQDILRARLLFLEKANITHADKAASTFNRMGFKTGSGQQWTPRLINVAKMKLLGWKPEIKAGSTSAKSIKSAQHPKPKAGQGIVCETSLLHPDQDSVVQSLRGKKKVIIVEKKAHRPAPQSK